MMKPVRTCKRTYGRGKTVSTRRHVHAAILTLRRSAGLQQALGVRTTNLQLIRTIKADCKSAVRQNANCRRTWKRAARALCRPFYNDSTALKKPGGTNVE